MFTKHFFRYRFYYCAHIPGLVNSNPRDNPHREQRLEPSSGVERIVDLFQPDEHGELKKEVVSSVQITFGSGILSAFYGGLRYSKGAFENWITLNSSTRFRTSYQAKRALHDYIALEFSKYFIIYGVKGMLFSGILMFSLIITSAFRGKNGILEFTTGGLLAGSFMRITSGLKGMLSGAILGAGLSSVTGLTILLLSKISNTTIDDVRKWQYDIKMSRKNLIEKSRLEEDTDTMSKSLRHYTSRLTKPDVNEKEKIFILMDMDRKQVKSNTADSS